MKSEEIFRRIFLNGIQSEEIISGDKSHLKGIQSEEIFCRQISFKWNLICRNVLEMRKEAFWRPNFI